MYFKKIIYGKKTDLRFNLFSSTYIETTAINCHIPGGEELNELVGFLI